MSIPSINVIEKASKIIDWFIKLPASQQVLALLITIILVLGGLYMNSERKSHNHMEEKLLLLEQKIEDCNLVFEENRELQNTITQMKVNTIMLKASSDYLPFPFWIKDRSGIMVYVNSAYEDRYLIPKSLRATDYIGRTDSDIWGDIVGARFRENDSIVLARNRPITFTELDGQKFTKFTIQLGDYIIGVAGVEYIDYE